MAQLCITINQVIEADYDGLELTNKHATVKMDGENLPCIWTEGLGIDDSVVKTNFKNHLTSLGYTWDSEV